MISEMDDFPGLLAKDYGFRAQGRAAPMAGSKGTAGGTINFGIGSGGDGNSNSSTWNSTPVGNSFLDDESLFRSSDSEKNHGFDGLGGYNDVYGGPPKYSNESSGTRKHTSFDYDAMFQGTKDSSEAKPSSLPVYDKPVYDDDIFDGVPGIKSTSSPNYDDVFATISSPPKQSDHFDDLLGNLEKNEPTKSKGAFHIKSEQINKGANDYEDLLPGFDGSSPLKNRRTPETSLPHKPTAPINKSAGLVEDPFVIIKPNSASEYESENFKDPLEHIDDTNKAVNSRFSPTSGGGVFDPVDPLEDLATSVPSFSFGAKNEVEDRNRLRKEEIANSTHGAAHGESAGGPFFQTAKSGSPKVEVSPKSEVTVDSSDDIWITVSEVPLFTQPTTAPPPSRPPPPKPVQVSRAGHDSLNARTGKARVNEFPSFHHFSPSYQSPAAAPSSGHGRGVSSIDELEDFAMGRIRDHTNGNAHVLFSEEEVDTNSAAAAMKEAMDRAEAKFKYARELREKESVKTAKNREASHHEKDEKAPRDARDQELREKQERFDREQREREEKERLDREKRRLDKEREQARQVVERAAREARERAAAEARQRAQKAAVEKATLEARERAERAAVQRAQVEARERAAAEAKERVERAAAEARERSNAEARERAASVARAESEARARAARASVDRATAEARERAAAAAAAAAKEYQQKNENDLESFFSMGSRASSAPRPNRTPTSESPFDSQFQNKPAPEVPQRTPPGTSSTIRKASATTNIVDDLTSIFGGETPSGQFQEIDGESDERRRARLERHQRTQERAAKALAEKNERDRQTQRDQAERHRIAGTLDIEIKRWSTGKEGNLRALLSTMQYVLWPECGWQPVSLTDLITAAAVKKAYRKATLCIHPDKVQQKGANLQQKYIAEKVFDLLKEAWNKFNSEELF